MMLLCKLKQYINKEKNIIEGFKIYKKIKRKYGENTVICVSQHGALGDAYLSALYLKTFYKNKKFVVTALGSGCKRVYEYFDIQKIVMLDNLQTDNLICFCQLLGITRDDVNILHHQALKWHTGILWEFQGIRGLNFAQLIEIVVFNNISRTQRQYPKIKKHEEGIKLFTKYNLKKGKTVILFPYTNTLKPLDVDTWKKIVLELRKKGYCVATYVYNNETALEYTTAIKGDFDEIAVICELSGMIVGVRSGMMDILSQCNCKKIILYPSKGAESWIKGSIINYWSLNSFGYCSDAQEYEY